MHVHLVPERPLAAYSFVFISQTSMAASLVTSGESSGEFRGLQLPPSPKAQSQTKHTNALMIACKCIDLHSNEQDGSSGQF